jgi:hypothetical protein
MTRIERLLSLSALSLLFFFTTSAFAQVPSYSPDDVPRGFDAYYVTYTGSEYRSGPNHQLAYVQTAVDEQKVWFSVDSGLKTDATHPGPNHSYYNRRYRGGDGQWYWQYADSQPISGVIGFVDTVLYSDTYRYGDPYGQSWKYIMYTVNQPTLCNNDQFGYAMVQYSNDGVNWNNSGPLHHAGGPSSDCAQLGPNLVAVEALDAIDDGSGTIWLIGEEGSVSTLVQPSNMDQTFASWGSSQYATSSSVTIDGANTMVSNSGVFSPALPGADPTRFKTYAYFFNMAMAWDPIPGDLYLTRGYPYPFDRTAGTPSVVPSASVVTQTNLFNSRWGVDQLVQGCATSPGIFPNRYQIYKMHLGSLSNFSLVHTGTWTLVADRGGAIGYLADAVSPNTGAPLVSGQTAGSREEGAASFFRNGQGSIPYTSPRYTFGATTLMAQMSGGQCAVTGFEGIVADSLP